MATSLEGSDDTLGKTPSKPEPSTGGPEGSWLGANAEKFFRIQMFQDEAELALLNAMELNLPADVAMVYVTRTGELKFGVTRPWSHPLLQQAKVGDNLIDIYAGTPYAQVIAGLLSQAATGVTGVASTSVDGSPRILQASPFGEDGVIMFIRNRDPAMRTPTVGELLESLQLVGEVSERIRHDINGPLLAMQSFTRLVKRLTDNPKNAEKILPALAEQVQGVLDAVQLVNHLINELHIETNTVRLATEAKVEEMKFEQLIQSVMDMEIKRHPNRNINVVVDPNANRISSIKVYLLRILANVISNAMKYSPEGSQVDIYVTRQGENIHIEVQDHGIGMAPEDLAKLFSGEQFRTASGAAFAQGTGRGNTIVKDLVGKLQGELLKASEVGVGTRITVILPVVWPDSPEGTRPATKKTDSLPDFSADKEG